MDNRCSHISDPEKTETVAEALFSPNKSKRLLKPFTAYFHQRQEPVVNISILEGRRKEAINTDEWTERRKDNLNVTWSWKYFGNLFTV